MKYGSTIIDVARASGVSTATVSRVINNGLVKEKTKQRVNNAIQALGYRRNTLARGLVTGKTGVIGVLIPDVLGPLYGQMARGIEDVLVPLGIHYMMLSDNRNPESEKKAIGLLIERRVDALIIIGSYLDGSSLSDLTANKLGIVLVQPELPNNITQSTITVDNYSGVKEALNHFIALGHKNIAHVSGIRYDGEQRKQIFIEILKDAGLAYNFIFSGKSNEESGLKAAASISKNKNITAVFCTNDITALGLYHGLKSHGIRIPEDISVIGFDNLPWTAYLDPPLSTIRQPARAVGKLAAKQALLEIQQTPNVVKSTLKTELISRLSVKNLLEEEVNNLTNLFAQNPQPS